MSKKKTNENKEHIDESDDESKIDWSNFGEVWAKLYYGPEETPPELNKPLRVEELNAYLDKEFGE